MNDAEQKQVERYKTAIPFRGDEKERFEDFIDSTGRKAGPFLRVLSMRVVRDWESSNDQATGLRKLMERDESV